MVPQGSQGFWIFKTKIWGRVTRSGNGRYGVEAGAYDIYGEEKGRHIFLKMPDGGMVLLFNPDETSKEGQDLPPHFASGHQHLAFEVEKTEYPAWKARVQRASTAVLQ